MSPSNPTPEADNTEAKDLVRSMFEGSYQGVTKPSQLGPIKH
jgi:hypothetical protein